MLHIDALSVYVLIFFTLAVILQSLYKSFPNVLGYATDIRTAALYEFTNVERSQNGLPPLALNTTLTHAAAEKANDMISKNYWAHNSPTGQTPWEFIVGSGYSYKVAGENLAKNFDTSANVVQAWMASPSHRENILKSSYQDVGYAVVNGVLNGEETTLVVQMFGTSSVGPVSRTVQAQALPEPTPVQEPVNNPPVGEESPVVITEVASQTEEPRVAPFTAVASAFSRVSQRPFINIAEFWRELAFVFLGMLTGVLIVDAWLIARRRTVRLVGHNVAHIFFLGSFLFITQYAARGSLL